VTSIKENLLKTMRGEMPDYVPRYRLMYNVQPAFYNANRKPDMSGRDVLGVEYVNVHGTGPIPVPNRFVFEDITRWREYVKLPDISEVDFSAQARAVRDGWNPEWPMGTGGSAGFFQALYNYMGFTNALVACVEEPEEVKALINHLADFYVEVVKKMIYHFKPDYGTIGDDVAHANGPFLSLSMWRELVKPCWKRYMAVYKDAGLPVILHDCGHNMILADDFVEMGINAWEPAEEVNDLLAVKAKHGRKLALFGGFRQNGVVACPETTESQVRAEVRKSIEKYAPGGGYGFCGIVLGAVDDAVVNQRNAWIADEYEKIAGDPDFYKKYGI
jgi:hypothetical protein